MVIACASNFCSDLDHYKIRRVDSVTFGAPDLIERLKTTALKGLSHKPGSNFILATNNNGLEVLDYTDLTTSSEQREKGTGLFPLKLHQTHHIDGENRYIGRDNSLPSMGIFSWIDDSMESQILLVGVYSSLTNFLVLPDLNMIFIRIRSRRLSLWDSRMEFWRKNLTI